MIKTLAEYDITYPTEMDHRGQVTDHVTTLSSHTRRRRSLSEETGPIIYQVLNTIQQGITWNWVKFVYNFGGWQNKYSSGT